jgi:hypothetical protein
MTSRLWNRGICSVSVVVYLQQNDSRRLTAQEIQHKSLGTSDMIGDAWSERKTLPLVVLNSFISVISNSDIRAMSTTFCLELIPKLWLWFLVVFIWFVVSISCFFREFVKILIGVQNRQISRLSNIVMWFWCLYIIQMIWSSS